jgi:hypothetical protein
MNFSSGEQGALALDALQEATPPPGPATDGGPPLITLAMNRILVLMRANNLKAGQTLLSLVNIGDGGVLVDCAVHTE